MSNKTTPPSRDITDAEFADAHVEVAARLPDNPAAALAELKEAFKYDERDSILAYAEKIAKHVADPLVRTDFYSFVASHTKNAQQKTKAVDAAVKALCEAAGERKCEQRPSSPGIGPEGIASRALDIFSVLNGNFTQSFGVRGQLMAVWHKQITALMAQDEAAGTFRTRTFLGQETVRRSLTGYDEYTIGVLNGAVKRVLEDNRSDASAAAPVLDNRKAAANGDAARAALIEKAWHTSPGNSRLQ